MSITLNPREMYLIIKASQFGSLITVDTNGGNLYQNTSINCPWCGHSMDVSDMDHEDFETSRKLFDNTHKKNCEYYEYVALIHKLKILSPSGSKYLQTLPVNS